MAKDASSPSSPQAISSPQPAVQPVLGDRVRQFLELAQLIQQLAPQIAETIKAIRDIFTQFTNLTQEERAQVMSMVSDKPPQS